MKHNPRLLESLWLKAALNRNNSLKRKEGEN